MIKVNIFLDSANILPVDLKGQWQLLMTFYSLQWESNEFLPVESDSPCSFLKHAAPCQKKKKIAWGRECPDLKSGWKWMNNAYFRIYNPWFSLAGHYATSDSSPTSEFSQVQNKSSKAYITSLFRISTLTTVMKLGLLGLERWLSI